MNNNKRRVFISALEEAKQIAENPEIKAFDDVDELFFYLNSVKKPNLIINLYRGKYIMDANKKEALAAVNELIKIRDEFIDRFGIQVILLKSIEGCEDFFPEFDSVENAKELFEDFFDENLGKLELLKDEINSRLSKPETSSNQEE